MIWNQPNNALEKNAEGWHRRRSVQDQYLMARNQHNLLTKFQLALPFSSAKARSMVALSYSLQIYSAGAGSARYTIVLEPSHLFGNAIRDTHQSIASETRW